MTVEACSAQQTINVVLFSTFSVPGSSGIRHKSSYTYIVQGTDQSFVCVCISYVYAERNQWRDVYVGAVRKL